ncbi:acyl-ACP--UDP-N-acetylglucosamine O-acyltransferase [Phyllobacterium sp. 21LDTY02-6]|jgi:UDP-N-acetylglucosamine acyltransferase|uniref:acyl-ACP--UDP-N-acetylglucosamine O-acyltransferase n=1 Tax=unclassified Phyllobacterium TaxID=2638441 RepID=UPI0020203F4D|nr:MULTISPECIES: acyl-ACP--UDP-N-acetylglucosamine O-acyltransferase [unclassified Phyllobacterium]MCO4316511.1 acyl-ACP--UDP-N-acetylglucosamine O-acyltransferase [Phyllobacterium sp. 21LDTY02-6]MCX8280687.1 acyl-ACP--UDP-N-acetylglucosamine O-acyltransferase [Phyllobacterium sp. 0TCS1.6C]MCX8292736.1 acyl-ACP--UDP-N-acetylglucosamine O-acyltransferase [Phyllobacterium sp. 0TCS1.6A]
MSEITIHPSAIIEKGAEIGAGVSIGPFCHVGADAVIGEGSRLLSHVVVMGATSLGRNAVVYPNAVLGGEPQNTKHKGGRTTLVIGDNCVIREGVTMHRGTDGSRGVTSVGDNCMFLAYSHVAHDCIIGDHVTFSNNVMIGGHVTVGNNVIIGGGAGIHQFVRIGHHAFIGGLAALASDLVPYGMAIGNHAYLGGLNIIGMKRSGMARPEIHNLRHAVRMLFDRSKAIKSRAEDVRAAFPGSAAVADLIDFITTDTKRAYCTPPLDSGIEISDSEER